MVNVYIRFPVAVAVFCVLQTCFQLTGAKIVGAFVLPHGGIALDPRNFNTTNQTALDEAKQLHQACKAVGQDIVDVKPDVIFLSTPHGLADYKNFALYMNSEAAGYGDVDDCLYEPCRYNLSVRLDSQLTNTIFRLFGYERNVSALTGFGPFGNDNAFPLRWGEVIPLLFPGDSLATSTKIVILSQPTRRYTDDVAMIPELLKLGGDLFPLLEDLPERVAMVVSSDLAHTHQASGPYGYSNASQPFDDAISRWAEQLDSQALLETAASLVDRALSCGYTGLVMLHGMLSRLPLQSSWKPSVYANLYPSYRRHFETHRQFPASRIRLARNCRSVPNVILVLARSVQSVILCLQAISRWAGQLDSQALLETAASLVDRALSCGYTGLVMLHGLLSRLPLLSSWKPSVYANLHPSYYGMMAATFRRVGDSQGDLYWIG